MTSLRLKAEQYANRLTFNPTIQLKFRHFKKTETLPKRISNSSITELPDSIREKSKIIYQNSMPYLSKAHIYRSDSLKFIPEQRTQEIKKIITDKAESENSSLVWNKREEDNNAIIEKNNEINSLNSEVSRLLIECKKLEDSLRKYEKRYNSIKLKVSELENENEFLKKRLKEALKEIKEIKSFDIQKESLKLINSSKKAIKVGEEYQSKTSTGVYLTNLRKQYNPDSKKFFEEIENFLDYKDFKLSKTINHYKSIIENLKSQLKLRNSESIQSMELNNLGLFFAECVEEVKKFILTSRKSTKLLTRDKTRLLEMFLLNQNVLKIIHNNLIEYSRDVPEPVDPSNPNDKIEDLSLIYKDTVQESIEYQFLDINNYGS